MISVIAPVLNEARFIRAWCECVTRFSDDIHVYDCGSTDGTLDILREYEIDVRYGNVAGDARNYMHREGDIINSLIDGCKHSWIVNLDADELVGSDFIEALPDLQRTKRIFIRLLWYHFWYSPNLIRVRQW